MRAAFLPIAARLRQMRRQLVLWGAAALLAGLAIIFLAMAFYMTLARHFGEPLAAAFCGALLALGALVLFLMGRRPPHARRPVAAAAMPPPAPRPMESLLVAFLLGVIDEQFGRRPRR